MKPDKDMVSQELINFRRPILQRFNQTVESEHESLVAEDYDTTACPRDIAYPTDLDLLSDAREKSEHLIGLVSQEIFRCFSPNCITSGLLN
jgi:hypothetical protein